METRHGSPIKSCPDRANHQDRIFTMALREKLEEDIKSSMRNHDQARLDALRFFKNAVQAVEK